MDNDEASQLLPGSRIPDKNEAELDPFQFLNMSAFDDVTAVSPPSHDLTGPYPTSNVDQTSGSPGPLMLPPPVAPSTYTSPISIYKPRPSSSSSFQSFNLSSFGPQRNFQLPFTGMAYQGVRQPQDSDVHSSKYDSTAESSFYESPWFSSSSQSLMTPGSPQSGYHSAGSIQEFAKPNLPRHDGRPYHRSTASYPFGTGNSAFTTGARKRGSVDSGIASRTESLGLRASSDEACPSATKSEPRDEQDDDFDGDDNVDAAGSDPESEYVESRRDVTARKRPRKMKDTAQIDEGEESEFADIRGPGHPRPGEVRNTRLQSERKRRGALSSAFQDLRSLLPADVQRATKSHVLECAADEIRNTRLERDRYRQLLMSLKAKKGMDGNQGDDLILPPMPTPN